MHISMQSESLPSNDMSMRKASAFLTCTRLGQGEGQVLGSRESAVCSLLMQKLGHHPALFKVGHGHVDVRRKIPLLATRVRSTNTNLRATPPNTATTP